MSTEKIEKIERGAELKVNFLVTEEQQKVIDAAKALNITSTRNAVAFLFKCAEAVGDGIKDKDNQEDEAALFITVRVPNMTEEGQAVNGIYAIGPNLLVGEALTKAIAQGEIQKLLTSYKLRTTLSEIFDKAENNFSRISGGEFADLIKKALKKNYPETGADSQS